MQVCVLGPLIVRDATAEVGAGGRRQRRVLARLAMSPGQAVSLDQLEQAAWGDEPPAAARHTLASHVFRLRRLGLAIATQDDRYLLETPTDIAEVERLANAGRAAEAAGKPAEAAAALRMALGLWRGPALSDLDDLPEAVVAAAQLEELLDGLREKLLALDLDSSEPAELVAEARRMASEQPYRERRWELLMLALYRAGRQAEALDAYAECRRRLLDDLGLDPGAGLHRMQQAVLAQDPALDAPPVSAQGGTDQSSSEADGEALAATVGPARIPGTSTRLIGRVVEQHDLSEVWDRARLATLLGPPGAGKTRLGLELARNAPGPVWYVSLEQLPEAQSVAGAILDVVAPSSWAVDARIGVANALGAGPGLLVLDGCEARLAETVREVGAILAASPQVRVLATSRERLGVLDEAVVPIGPLPPDDAISLLVDRARLVDPRFRLTPDEMAGADHLCALVDRLPLGVELVARHLHLLRVDEVIQRVEADLRRWGGGPVGGRAGLWAALDASVDRLGSNEKRALLGLAVMVADADLDLIEAVADLPAVGADSFEIVARLVDASLVQVRSAVGPTRYELLRTLTTYTLETSTAPDIEAARSRYAEAVLQRAARLTEQLVSAGRSDTLRRLDREMPHVRAVLGSLVAGPKADPATVTRGLEIAVGLSDYWLGRHPAEGLDWLGRLIEAADPAPPLRAAALLARGHLAYWVTDFVRGAEIVAEAQVIFASLGDRLGEGRALRRRGAIAAATDDMPAARRYLEASLARLEEAGVDREIGTTLLHLGSLLADEGVVDAARPALERALAIAAATADPLANGHVLAALALAHWKGGDLEAAMQTGNQAMLIFRELGHRPTEGTVACRLAAVARGLDRPRAARRYAQLAIDAGEQSSTRTTVALGHLNLARVDLDMGDEAGAAGHLVRSLERIDPVADRWVLVEALEAVARLLAASERPGSGQLLTAAATIRRVIHQPVPPTELADLEWTVAQGRSIDGSDRPPEGDPPASGTLGPAEAHALAAAQARELARPAPGPARLRRARG